MTSVVEDDIEAIWSSVPRETLDRLTSLACKSLNAPIAVLVSFAEGRRDIRGASGLDRHVFDVSATDGLCRRVFESPEMIETGVVSTGAFIGIRVRLSNGRVLGTFCVISTGPRTWTQEEGEDLCELAHCVSARIGLGIELGLRETAAAALVNINHELRTPLQAILGFTEFLRIDQKPDVVAEHARTIQSAAESLLALVNQTLDIAEGESDASAPIDPQAGLETLDVRAFAETCLRMVEPLALAKSLTLHLDIDDGVPVQVSLDAQKIRQALLNLLNNAVKFTDTGSVALCIARTDDRIRFNVRDSGIGIDPSDRDLLFHRFSRINAEDRPTDGTGLGLSITKDLVESLDGTIGVEANSAGGSIFWIDVPIGVGATGPAPVQKAEAPADQPGARILLADDLDLNRKLIADMLSLDGHMVDCVADGAAAVTAARAQTYDLILMDMIMPVMDGLAATRAIRAMPAPFCKVPIVALTAHSFREQLDACLAAGMDATLTKPMSIDALMRAVDTWTRDRVEAA